VTGRSQKPQDLSGNTGNVTLSSSEHFMDIGPKAAGSKAARHLGVQDIGSEFSVPSPEE